jgi:hypothetical protein
MTIERAWHGGYRVWREDTLVGVIVKTRDNPRTWTVQSAGMGGYNTPIRDFFYFKNAKAFALEVL